MGYLIRKIAMATAQKAVKIDPADFMTQDTAKAVIDIIKEVLLP